MDMKSDTPNTSIEQFEFFKRVHFCVGFDSILLNLHNHTEVGITPLQQRAMEVAADASLIKAISYRKYSIRLQIVKNIG